MGSWAPADLRILLDAEMGFESEDEFEPSPKAASAVGDAPAESKQMAVAYSEERFSFSKKVPEYRAVHIPGGGYFDEDDDDEDDDEDDDDYSSDCDPELAAMV